MAIDIYPSLYGVSGKSNRDTTSKSHWGKNEFNSSFPTSLLCYMHSKGKKAVYLQLDKQLQVIHRLIDVAELFQINPENNDAYFSFEDSFTPFQEYILGQLPRSDLVIMDKANTKKPWKRGLEIKLTALPDNSTHSLTDDKFSCEMVFRPPAIVHLALSISNLYAKRKKDLAKILSPVCSKVFNWRNAADISAHTQNFIEVINKAFLLSLGKQEPFIVQPIWKTLGKTSILHNNCLDVFVWSNFAFARLFIDSIGNGENRSMTRQQRCLFWLVRMIYDFAQVGVLNPSLITSEMAYELQTDKAFSIPGIKSWKYLHCDELSRPRISKSEIKHIILGGGQKYLSPERRFDAAIVNTPDLF